MLSFTNNRLLSMTLTACFSLIAIEFFLFVLWNIIEVDGILTAKTSSSGVCEPKDARQIG